MIIHEIVIICRQKNWSNKAIKTLSRQLANKAAAGYRNISIKVGEYFPLSSGKGEIAV